MSPRRICPNRPRGFWMCGLALLGCSGTTNDATTSAASAGSTNTATRSLSSGGGSPQSQQGQTLSSGASNTTTDAAATIGGSSPKSLASASDEATGGASSSGRRFNSATIGASGGNSGSRNSSGGNSNSRVSVTTATRTTGGSSATTTTATKAAAGGSTSNSGDCLGGPELVVPDGYTLVWADEFNIDGDPDPSNWGYENGFVRNEEAQWYQPDNAWVEQGCLIIEGRRERKANPNYKAGGSDWKTSRQYAEYTSSSLRSMGKRTWQYGRFEMRGRIKTQAGLWPAWWTLGEAKEWPSCGEIDIMEYYAGYVRANVASGTSTRWQAKWDSASWKVADFENKNWQNEFHVWRMDWDAQNIVLYLDDKQFNTTKLSDMLNPDGSSPFKQPHYMLLNLAIGGNNGGNASSTTFPTRFEVDYVRVFQKQ